MCGAGTEHPDSRVERRDSAPTSCSRAPRVRAPLAPAGCAATRSVSASNACGRPLRMAESYRRPSRLCPTRRRDAIDRGRNDRKARRHVFEDLQRRPVEAQRQGRVAVGIERRDTDITRRQARGNPIVRQRAGEDHARRGRSAASRTRGSSGPSPMKTAPMSRRPRARSSRSAVTM